ncbi:MAG: precorrin-6Y C5,15-methyltransferase (decarboxylating) subunit CbiT [Peptoniphilus sp.]|nr:precorrin-6Y C5,15-methyltransferase (decarboxylating) subunit CbiT [Peptoniphilus sp.]MDY3118582.1 precorrin-6Y C5,15-methyltransferase (decarboxylating) subunit CbiT [Peptoniphilus sp.]
MNWKNDGDFVRGAVPMTKEEVRILTMAGLDLIPGLSFLDIGAGTGSISVAAASLGCAVTAVEEKDEAVNLIKKNAEAFDVEVNVIYGKAPDCLEDGVYDRIFIGGSKGRLEEILNYAHNHLAQDGVMTGNFITMTHAERMKSFFKEKGYDWTLTYVAVSREDRLGLLRAENGVFILKGRRG